MRNILSNIFFMLFLLLSCSQANAQLEGGIKLGVSTYDYINDEISILTLFNDRGDIPEYELEVENINFGYHVGLYGRLTVSKVFLQIEALGNSATVNYKITDLTSSIEDKILKEQYTNLDIPVLLGVKLKKWINVQAGVNGHIPITTISELRTIEGYDISSQDFTFSFLGGFGIDIWKIRFDTRFELNSTLFGNEITYKGNTYVFEDSDNRIVASLAYKF